MKEKPKKNFFIHSTAVADEKVKIGDNTKIWHFSHIQKGAIIGKNCILGQNVNVARNVIIGNNVKIQNNVSIYEGVELEDYVFCGPSMVFTNIIYPRAEFPQNNSKFYKKTLIKKFATLGANCTILSKTTVGRYAMIGAGSVILKDVPDFALIVGNPGRQIGWVDEKGHKIKFDQNGKSTCSRFRLKNNHVTMIKSF